MGQRTCRDTSQDGRRDGEEDPRDLCQNAIQNKEARAEVPSGAIGTTRNGDDTVVLWRTDYKIQYIDVGVFSGSIELQDLRAKIDIGVF